MRIIILPFIFIGILFSCANSTNTKEEISSLTEQLTGEWNNISIRININSKNNSDTNDVFEVNRPEWEEKLKIKPIRTFFRPDSTWNSAHYNLKDSLIYNPSGRWRIEKDKLIMLQDFPSPDTTSFSITLKKDTASFESMLDWDMDGKKDDLYFGRQVKIE